MTTIKSSKGRSVDLAQLKSQNQFMRAVGNMGVNARGDIIDSYNNIVVPVNQRVGELNNQVIKPKLETPPPVIEEQPTQFNPVGLTADKPKRKKINPKELTNEEKELDDDEGI